ncbi:MAG: hypothetical protein GC168_13225 [Candidatus Hydrogenedens sp.]|nr:hypothetical protein [Candidatus Hydrogenedens sp.]
MAIYSGCRHRLIGSVVLLAMNFDVFAQIPGDQWATNGIVRAVARTDESLYVGGDFTQIGIKTGAFVVFDAAGTLLRPFLQVHGIVYAVVPDGAGGWYVGGAITDAAGVPRDGVLHVLADGSLDTAFAPVCDGTVYALALSGNMLYLGGDFGIAGGQARSSLAALDATSGDATPWNPGVDGVVRALLLAEDTVYVGGAFAEAGGAVRQNVAGIRIDTGQADGLDVPHDRTVYALAMGNGTLFCGGAFRQAGGLQRKNLSAIDTATGTLKDWSPNVSIGTTCYALALEGNMLVVAADDGFPDGVFRFNATTGVTLQNPLASQPVHSLRALATTSDAYYTGSIVGGLSAFGLESDLHTGWAGRVGGAVNAIAIADGLVAVGGDFRISDTQGRSGMAEFDAASGMPTDWRPSAQGTRCFVLDGDLLYAAGASVAAYRLSPEKELYWKNSSIGGGSVRAMALHEDQLFLGGTFKAVDQRARRGLASVSATTGWIGSFDPTAVLPEDHVLWVYALATTGCTVYAGGAFTALPELDRNYLAQFEIATSALTAWDPRANGPVRALSLVGESLFAGGDFSRLGGAARAHLGAIDVYTGVATDWDPGADGPVHALAAAGDTVYAGGSLRHSGRWREQA